MEFKSVATPPKNPTDKQESSPPVPSSTTPVSKNHHRSKSIWQKLSGWIGNASKIDSNAVETIADPTLNIIDSLHQLTMRDLPSVHMLQPTPPTTPAPNNTSRHRRALSVHYVYHLTDQGTVPTPIDPSIGATVTLCLPQSNELTYPVAGERRRPHSFPAAQRHRSNPSPTPIQDVLFQL
jgi:hypothetical protein